MLLQGLDHPNILKLKEVVTSPASSGPREVYMVLEFMHHDLSGLIRSSGRWFSHGQTKCYVKQFLEGLAYLHANGIVHRDLKTANLLLTSKNELKIADFGLAKCLSPGSERHTNRVITQWYRPPELFLGTDHYGTEVDMWSAGCVIAELLLGRTLFPGTSEVNQLELIFRCCGTPSEAVWPGVSRLPYFSIIANPKVRHPRHVLDTFVSISPEGAQLLDCLLVLDPSKRLSAKDSLQASYFHVAPPDPHSLPVYPSSHDMTTRQQRQQPLQPQCRQPQPQRRQLQPQSQLHPQRHPQSHLRPRPQPQHQSQRCISHQPPPHCPQPQPQKRPAAALVAAAPPPAKRPRDPRTYGPALAVAAPLCVPPAMPEGPAEPVGAPVVVTLATQLSNATR
eukprot:TRINITY_DN4070_c0_g1_i1.p1 TRINITY_DN4070_c0_g1~~TRINITY_DN4070_c0_g1_i1.p1  ORF type:complete len:393 (-),score=55.47 TRINITY_DN4070_c0_g1_i1:71-1249(-)